MQSLKSVIAVFRQEILAALDDEAACSGNIHLTADRIVLSLAVSIRPRAGDAAPEFAFDVLERGPSGENQSETGHRLTIEFKARDARRSEAPPGQAAMPVVPEAQKAGAVDLEGTEAQRLVETLAAVFGGPGFDSSARATVFRETLEGLEDSQVRAVVRALRDGRTPDSDPVAQRAWGVLSRLVRSGPSKSVTKGGEILSRVFGQFPVMSVVRLLEETWKTQDDWLGQPVRRPRLNGKKPKDS